MACKDLDISFPDAGDAKDLAKNWKLIYSEICAIQQAILEAVSQCQEGGGKFCTIVKGTSPMTFVESVSQVFVTSGGSGYELLSPVTVIYDPNGGQGAETTTVMEEGGGEVKEVIVENGGYGYSTDTTAEVITDPELDPPTSVAQVVVMVTENTYGTDPTEYYYVLIGQSDNRVLREQMDYVMSYFRNLGYTIIPTVNPETLNTIQWSICW